MENYDVVIAGAGTGGSILAQKLALLGLSVLLLDKKQKNNIGHDWSDSIEKKAFELAKIPLPDRNELTAYIKKLVVYAPDGTSPKIIDDYPYYIVDRKAFGKRLLEDAINAGADFKAQAVVKEPLIEGDRVSGVRYSIKGKDMDVKAKLVVDATGIESILRTKLPPSVGIDTAPFKASDMAKGYREVRSYRSDDPSLEQNILIYYYGKFGGYSWVHRETEKTVDVGAGVSAIEGMPEPTELVKRFCQEHTFIEKKKFRGGGGFLPVRRSIYSMVADGFLVLGDAASQAVPLNGCNCGTIMIAAEIASKVISKAIKENNWSKENLWQYNVEYQRSRGATLAAMDYIRTSLQSISEQEIILLFKTDLLSADNLSRSFALEPPIAPLLEKFDAIFKGLTAPALFLRLTKTILNAEAVYKLYLQYPERFQKEEFSFWVNKVSSYFQL